MKNAIRLVSVVILFVLCIAISGIAHGRKEIVNPKREAFIDAYKGKRVIFLPCAMGFDLTESWAAVMKKQADELGYSFEIRDPNWSIDMGTRALTAMIAEKPDLMVVHNPDVQSYARLLKQAQAKGIKVIQINMESVVSTDLYIGADWIGIGEKAARAMVDHCKKINGSGKVAIVEGKPTAAPSYYQMQGYHNIFDNEPSIKIVAVQAALYDPVKGRNIMETILKQHPDLCAVVSNWDGGGAPGVGTAVIEAGLSDQVYVVTTGGGHKTACENVAKGILDMDVCYNSPQQGQLLNMGISMLLQSKLPAGAQKLAYYNPLILITKDSLSISPCFTIDQLTSHFKVHPCSKDITAR